MPKYEPAEDVKDVVSTVLARLGIAIGMQDHDTIDAIIDDIDELYASDPGAVLELYKATTLLAATIAVKSFTGGR